MFISPIQSNPAVYSEKVVYRHGEVQLEGYLAYDKARPEQRPGILVVHEWWGINDYVKRRADQLAQLGYVAFALDMYGKGKTTDDPDEAAQLSSVYKNDPDLARARLGAGLEQLQQLHPVKKTSLAAIGYCFGGKMVLELARSGAPLKGVVCFHGGLSTTQPSGSGEIKAKVLVLHGADDPVEPISELRGFHQEMLQAGVDWQVIIYGGAMHSFTNPAADRVGIEGIRYNEKVDRRAWQAMLGFFGEIFSA